MTKGQLATLWALGVGIVSVFAALAYLLLRVSQPVLRPVTELPGPPTGAVPASTRGAIRSYSLPLTPHSARTLYHRAEQAAREWQPDAGLVSADTSWSFADLDGFSEPVDWTFSFFSPGTQRIYVVSVGQTEVTPLREALSPYQLPVIAPERWSIDSHQALGSWLDGGGTDLLLDHPVINVSAHLASEDGQPVWAIAGAAQKSQSVFAIKLDAAHGRPLG